MDIPDALERLPEAVSQIQDFAFAVIHAPLSKAHLSFSRGEDEVGCPTTVKDTFWSVGMISCSIAGVDAVGGNDERRETRRETCI